MYIGRVCPPDKKQGLRDAIIQFILKKSRFLQQELRTYLQTTEIDGKKAVYSQSDIRKHVSEFMTMKGTTWVLKRGDGGDE